MQPDMHRGADANTLLETKGLSRLGNTGSALLLKPTNFTLRGGDRVAITGSSGSGKSIFLRTLALLDTPGSGEVLWRHQPVISAHIPLYRSRICYIAQKPSLLDGSVEDNLRFPYSLRGLKHMQFDKAAVSQLLQKAGKKAEFLQKTANELSGGESQIVALIRTLQLAPQVMLLDEPTAALDPQSARDIEALINVWFSSESPSPRAFIWVSHDHEQALRMSDIRYEMHDGLLSGESTR